MLHNEFTNTETNAIAGFVRTRLDLFRECQQLGQRGDQQGIADLLRQRVEEERDIAGPRSDLLERLLDAAITRVDFDEIAGSYTTGADMSTDFAARVLAEREAGQAEYGRG